MPKIPIYIRQDGIDAKATFDPSAGKNTSVTILAGSILTIDPSKNAASNIVQNYNRLRRAIQDGDVVKRPDGRLEVVRDIPDQSPAGSWVIVSGKPGSGSKKWRIDGIEALLGTLQNGDAAARNPVNVPCATGQMNRVDEKVPCESDSSVQGCNSDCRYPCNIAIWERFGHSFWIRVWKIKFTPSVIPTLWNSWIDKAVIAASWRFSSKTESSRITAPVRSAMADRLYKFFVIDWHLHSGTSPGDFLSNAWLKLLEGLNSDAARIAGIIWGVNGGVVYGRSQKVASLIGKYLMVDALLRRDFPAFKEFARLLPVVVDKEGTLDHLRKVAGFRGFSGSWVKKLNWNDYLTIQKAAKDLADSRCCESPAIYELCHMW